MKDSLHRADLSKVMEGLNVLGNIPWKINHLVLDTAWKCWENGIALGDIPSRIDYEIPPLPKANDYVDYKTLGDFEKKIQLEAYRKYREGVTKHNRFKQKNMDLHSLRCSAMLKLNQANKYKDFDEIFFPYNVDFRGRAYPVTPHLSIVGSDLCRALLMFSTPKPLGKDGLYWLKVHLANLAGADKMSFDGRAQFAEKNMDNIRATINDPLGDNDWWRKFDDPFQGLATCHEIVQAIDSGDPESYMCSLPVHMDGSCNGLQHYAALGRDRHGGKAVNLCVADEPQDVYIGVMHEVIKRVANDANEIIPFDEDKPDLSGSEKDLLKKVKSARLVNGLIDRGVVKRTVMTSVYGVTYIGAKTQIEEKIVEKLEAKGFDIDEKESDIHTACGYLASLTMDVMGQQFKGARQTMNWLTECARLIAAQGQPVSFVSPIGVPVVQPYRQRRAFAVVTLLQNVMLTNDSDILPLHRQRQVSAFPPNYVHSLDSSHMILTVSIFDDVSSYEIVFILTPSYSSPTGRGDAKAGSSLFCSPRFLLDSSL
jgi:DNA-directed RNA polymerase